MRNSTKLAVRTIIRERKEIKKELALYVAIAAISLIVFTNVLLAADVSGNSMNDTYQDGDRLICLRHSTPQASDVVICRTDNGTTLIKRVIAVAGDEIDIDFEKGTVSVNGSVLSEPYIKEPTFLDEGGFEYPVTVPEGCYFVMGDNRNASSDSRNKNIGFIKKENIRGRVIFEMPF